MYAKYFSFMLVTIISINYNTSYIIFLYKKITCIIIILVNYDIKKEEDNYKSKSKSKSHTSHCSKKITIYYLDASTRIHSRHTLLVILTRSHYYIYSLFLSIRVIQLQLQPSWQRRCSFSLFEKIFFTYLHSPIHSSPSTLM